MNASSLTAARQDAKARLREALETGDGDPGQPGVAAAIAHLATLNPTPAPALATDLLLGDWRLISAPSFPGGDRQADGTYRYTLGRLAFNMFQPQTLLVQIDRVSQPVWPLAGSSRHSHDIVVEFTVVAAAAPPLRGIVRNLGSCEPKTETALQVQFTGGVLEPAPGTDGDRWRQLLEASPPAPPGSLQERFQGWLLGLLFGLVPPTGMEAATGRMTFQMRRSPRGTLTLLYLDEDLRITRGQRETVLVCERVGTR